MVKESFPHAELRFHPGERVMEIVWTDFSSGDDFRRIVERAFDLAEQHGARYWLGNNAGLRPVRQADQDWMVAHILPRIVRVGFRRMAGVRSADPIARMAAETFATRMAEAVAPAPYQLFPDRPAAWAWLTAE